jgi:hypothetical protein
MHTFSAILQLNSLNMLYCDASWAVCNQNETTLTPSLRIEVPTKQGK